MGAPGPRGPEGPRGPAGDDAVPAMVRTLQPGDTNCSAGGIELTVNETTAYVCNGQTGAMGVEGPIGPQGGIGADGPIGPQGPEGPVGPQGAEGPPGQQGPPGEGFEYGDASAGAKVVSADETLADPVLMYADFTVNAGVTLTVPSGTELRCSGTFTNNGTIVVERAAYSGAALRADPPNHFVEVTMLQPHPGVSLLGAHSPRYGYSKAPGGKGLSSAQARRLLRALPFGGGGAGSAQLAAVPSGGGFFVVRAMGDINNAGIIDASGANGVQGSTDAATYAGPSGGGGGGVVVLASLASVTNSGTINASGGRGANSYATIGCPSGGGGGGIVHLLAPVTTVGSVNVAGGLAGARVVGECDSVNSESGAGGGGASGGDGGRGASWSRTNNPGAPFFSAQGGSAGYVFETNTDPTPLL